MNNLPAKYTKEIEKKNHDNRNGFIEGLLKLQSLKIFYRVPRAFSCPVPYYPSLSKIFFEINLEN